MILDLILSTLSTLLDLAKKVISDMDDPPPATADFIRRADAELLVLRGRLGGDQDAEDQAELDAAVPPADPNERCVSCGRTRVNHNVRHMFVSLADELKGSRDD